MDKNGETKKESNFVCELCGQSYDSEKGLNIHRTKLHEQGPSRDKLLRDLREAAERLGRSPSCNEFGGLDGCASPSVYRSWFGSWNDALTEAGLEPNQQEVSKKELIAEAERLAKELERTLPCFAC